MFAIHIWPMENNQLYCDSYFNKGKKYFMINGISENEFQTLVAVINTSNMEQLKKVKKVIETEFKKRKKVK